MDPIHSGIICEDVQSGGDISGSGPRSSRLSSDNSDEIGDPPLSPDHALTGIVNWDNAHICVTTKCVSLPIDMIVAIGEYLSVTALPRFFSMNCAIHALYRENQIGYAKSLNKIGSALRHSEIIDALAAITQYHSAKQPHLLRVLAENIRIKTHGPAYGTTTDWKLRIDAQFDWHATQPPGTERDIALQQLLIARGFALTQRHFSRDGTDLLNVVGDRLSAVSCEYWPPVFEAFLALGDIRNLLRTCKFEQKFNGCLPPISPEFGLMIAVEFLGRYDNTNVSALLHKQFGISDTCSREVLDPLIAVTVANAATRRPHATRNSWLINSARKWRRYDQNFMSCVTDTFLKLLDEKVYRKASFSYLLRGDFAVLPEQARRIRERTMLLEGPTISALHETEANAEDQVNAFLTMIDRIGNRPLEGEYVAVLNDIRTMPLVARPALLHRLVSNIPLCWKDRHTTHTFINAAVECRNTLISGDTVNSALVSRVSAALISAADALRKYDAAAAARIVDDASHMAFLRIAREDWGDVLQALIGDYTRGYNGSIEKWDDVDKHIVSFICLPNASARHLPDLLNRIEAIIGRAWAQLPDKADGARSRFDVFSERIGIKTGMGKIALASIAESLVPEVVADVHFLEDVATAAAFDDRYAIAALETALFALKISPNLRADSDVDAITNQYTKRSLYLRSLIAHAVHELEILSEFHEYSLIG